ncbi:MAG: CoA transferase [Chloroflexi bacterium]|nr:CoA transferase [Chloroflexota bacterium]
MSEGMQPLGGIRVIECSTWGFGPLAGLMLGDLGADVIKIESPTRPDGARTLVWGGGMDQRMPDGRGVTYETMNRNKRSLALDLKSPEGVRIIKELVRGADIFLENYRPGVMDRLGVGYEALRQVNPRVIYAAACGYGFKGEETERPAFDPVGAARSGLMWAAGTPDDPPVWINRALADMSGGATLAYGILAALAARERHGVGQRVEVSHIMATLWLQHWGVGNALAKGMDEWPRFDRRKAPNPMFNWYRCADDEWIMLSIADDERDWPKFCEAMGLQHLRDDTRFRSRELRAQHCEEAVRILDEVFATQPRAAWEGQLRTQPDLIFDRVQHVGDLLDDPAVRANAYIVEVDHPRYGSLPFLNHPVTLTETPASIRRVSPELGEHTREVLQEELGYEPEQVAELVAAGVVA